jgi:hypothetical protein
VFARTISGSGVDVRILASRDNLRASAGFESNDDCVIGLCQLETWVTHLDSFRTSIVRDAAMIVISKWSVCRISTMLRGLCATTLMPLRRRRLL